MAHTELVERDIEIRNHFWSQLGQVDSDVLAPMVNSAFTGGPQWPNLRQSVMFIHTDKGTIVTSDGLSDLWSDYDTNEESRSNNGIGLEVYFKTPDQVAAAGNPWQGILTYQMAQQAAHFGTQLAAYLDQYGIVSFELNDVGIPNEFAEHYVTDRGTVGLLLGGGDAEVPTTVSLAVEPVRFIKITLLTIAELDYAMANGETGRELVADRLNKEYDGYSALRTTSVV